MPTTITSAGITFNDTTSQTTSALEANAIGTTQIAANAVTAAKLGTNEQKQICKAWVNFDGTIATPSTIRASYNVSSITRTANGDYTINFTTALADANYSALISAGGGPAETYISLSLNTLSVGSLRIRTFNAVGLANYSILSVAVFDN